MALGVGSANGHRLVEGAVPSDSLTLTRFWLADSLPPNTASWALGHLVRALRRHTSTRFLLTYADPEHRYVGTIYQAAGWAYCGRSQPTPSYDIGEDKACHPRTLAHRFGSRSIKHFARAGMDVRQIPGTAKYRYICFVDTRWRNRLRVPELSYPKRQEVPCELAS